MKRRICVLLLAVMLALSLILCTGGMAEEKDFIVTVVSLADAFAKFENPDLYPERDIHLPELQEEIRSGQAPDLIITYGDIETLKELGAIVPFTPSEMLVKDFETMPPFIREATRKYLITEDGQFWGCIRGGLWLKTMLFYVPSAWADSPFHDRTPPTSFEEFLDFAEVYLDTPHEGFCLLYNWSNEKLCVQSEILSMLLDSWIIQQQYAGEPYRFTSDEFISLLDRTKKLFARLAKEEPLTQKKQKKLRELFTNPGVTYDGGKANCSRELYNWDHMIPYRVFANQPPLINIETAFISVGNSSADPAEITRCMEEKVRRRDRHSGVVEATYIHPEQMDVEVLNKWYHSYQKDGVFTQQWLDSIQRIQGVPCMTDPYWICGKATASDCDSLGRVNSQFMTSEKMTPEKYAEIWEGWSQ
ncbi:hypothetical protein [Aristaeella hokkaidonensis]|uniref:Uncharacterized protein n=1 Tax=Aristaeella hokkaidonensis TaxID=3046382 RepID=A0AC61MUK9_9FIRM|nr:hypothetical protein [Aristaeella hokkaidonensis]QUC65995.1 hypothetical protein JYE49_08915 [Aristaeella hokkaidonensis]SNT93782.1 hypothetical protein SAMN06297421_103105 [Aristaeella hokkaidonensis]